MQLSELLAEKKRLRLEIARNGDSSGNLTARLAEIEAQLAKYQG